MISTLFGSCMTLRTGTARLLLCRPVSTHSRLAKWCLSLACLHGTFLARGHQHVDFRYAYGSVTYFGRAFQEWILNCSDLAAAALLHTRLVVLRQASPETGLQNTVFKNGEGDTWATPSQDPRAPMLAPRSALDVDLTTHDDLPGP